MPPFVPQHFFFDIGTARAPGGAAGAGAQSSLAFFFFRDAPPAQPGVAAPDARQLRRKGERKGTHSKRLHFHNPS